MLLSSNWDTNILQFPVTHEDYLNELIGQKHKIRMPFFNEIVMPQERKGKETGANVITKPFSSMLCKNWTTHRQFKNKNSLIDTVKEWHKFMDKIILKFMHLRVLVCKCMQNHFINLCKLQAMTFESYVRV